MKFLNKSLFIISLATVSTFSYAGTYCDKQIGYCVDFPNSVTVKEATPQGNGRMFKLAHSNAYIMSSADYNTTSNGILTGVAYLKERQQFYHQYYRVTYELLKNNSYTVSGYDNRGIIFYETIKVKGNRNISIYFEYPTSDKAKMNNVIKQMQGSLRF